MEEDDDSVAMISNAGRWCFDAPPAPVGSATDSVSGERKDPKEDFTRASFSTKNISKKSTLIVGTFDALAHSPKKEKNDSFGDLGITGDSSRLLHEQNNSATRESGLSTFSQLENSGSKNDSGPSPSCRPEINLTTRVRRSSSLPTVTETNDSNSAAETTRISKSEKNLSKNSSRSSLPSSETALSTRDPGSSGSIFKETSRPKKDRGPGRNSRSEKHRSKSENGSSLSSSSETNPSTSKPKSRRFTFAGTIERGSAHSARSLASESQGSNKSGGSKRSRPKSSRPSTSQKSLSLGELGPARFTFTENNRSSSYDLSVSKSDCGSSLNSKSEKNREKSSRFTITAKSRPMSDRRSASSSLSRKHRSKSDVGPSPPSLLDAKKRPVSHHRRTTTGVTSTESKGSSSYRGGIAPPDKNSVNCDHKSSLVAAPETKGSLGFEKPSSGKSRSIEDSKSSRFSFSETCRTDSGFISESNASVSVSRRFSATLFNMTDPMDSAEEDPLRLKDQVLEFYFKNEFLILVVGSILLAKAYPALGAIYLYPQVTSTWIAVMTVFFASGLAIRTKNLAAATARMQFDVFVQMYTFFGLSIVTYLLIQFLMNADALHPSLGNGLIIVSCLPLSVHAALILTKRAGGDEAAAIFHATFSNFLGIFVSPVLILGYVGSQSEITLQETTFKLTLRVILPFLLGQGLQGNRWINSQLKKHKNLLRISTSYGMVWIVYTIFCRTFNAEKQVVFADIFILVCVEFFLYVSMMGLVWYALKCIVPDKPKLRAMGIFGCSMKAVAMGVPLIEAIYGGDPQIALYTLPLLVWYPVQSLVGSLVANLLKVFVESEKQRLGIVEVDKTEHDDSDESLVRAPSSGSLVGSSKKAKKIEKQIESPKKSNNSEVNHSKSQPKMATAKIISDVDIDLEKGKTERKPEVAIAKEVVSDSDTDLELGKIDDTTTGSYSDDSGGESCPKVPMLSLPPL